MDGRSLQVANTTLEESLRVEAIWDKPWANTNRSPAELRDAALEELDTDDEPGPSCRELLVKAAGHLAAQGWLKPQDPGAPGVTAISASRRSCSTRCTRRRRGSTCSPRRWPPAGGTRTLVRSRATAS